MQTVILCGGKGTRSWPLTEEIPKPLIPIGGRAVLGHLLQIYAEQGFTSFVLCGGHRVDRIVEFALTLPEAWDVEVVDTGEDTNTAGRLARIAHLLDGTFFANYADGLADLDLDALRSFHAGHAGLATLTSVPLPSPYGTIVTGDDGRIVEFREKPQLPEHRINAGWFVFDPEVFDTWPGEDLERDVLPALAAAGHLHAYEHDGFWRPMDTHKDIIEMSELARTTTPWRR